MKLIHLVTGEMEPVFSCDGKPATFSAHGRKKDLQVNKPDQFYVHLSTDGRMYTWDRTLVTCPSCKKTP